MLNTYRNYMYVNCFVSGLTWFSTRVISCLNLTFSIVYISQNWMLTLQADVSVYTQNSRLGKSYASLTAVLQHNSHKYYQNRSRIKKVTVQTRGWNFFKQSVCTTSVKLHDPFISIYHDIRTLMSNKCTTHPRNYNNNYDSVNASSHNKIFNNEHRLYSRVLRKKNKQTLITKHTK